MGAISDIPGIPGVPDPRNLKVKISRGSGMGPIHPGYALLVLLAFAFFVVVFWMILFYKRQKHKENERILFLTSY
ncbi:hypothetical protein HNY73_007872 [Argiope bruennichi]|uniref:Uncharacterized protein n=1 Tax=Argiope bruennichi TaxID=94029 RepID=A0A8T0F9Q5_ARGBR|nr:hypothetical protein HNY73_007872 [Argiope bruennichi]